MVQIKRKEKGEGGRGESRVGAWVVGREREGRGEGVVENSHLLLLQLASLIKNGTERPGIHGTSAEEKLQFHIFFCAN